MPTVASVCLVIALLPSAVAAQSPPTGGELESLRQRADAARANGQLAAAIGLYQRALALEPSWLEGQWSLGTSAYEAGNYEICGNAFRSVVSLDRQNGPGWAFKGLCEFEVKAFKDALDDLNEGHRLGLGDDPRFLSVVRYHRAILLTRFAEFDRALRAFAAFARGGNQSEQVVEGMGIAALRLPMLPSELPPQKRDAAMLAGRAAVAAAVNAAAEAEAAFSKLLARYPDEPNVHYLYGLYLQPEDPSKADLQFREELRRVPQHALATLQLAQAAMARADLAEATRLAAETVRLDSRNFVAHRVLGEVKMRSGDIRGAIAALETALKLESNSPSVHFQLAKAYQRAGRVKEATRERAEFTRLERLLRVERGGANAVGDVDEP